MAVKQSKIILFSSFSVLTVSVSFFLYWALNHDDEKVKLLGEISLLRGAFTSTGDEDLCPSTFVLSSLRLLLLLLLLPGSLPAK